jgi:hypothetical protein
VSGYICEHVTGKRKEERFRARSNGRFEDNIKMHLILMRCKIMVWNEMYLIRFRWCGFVDHDNEILGSI